MSGISRTRLSAVRVGMDAAITGSFGQLTRVRWISGVAVFMGNFLVRFLRKLESVGNFWRWIQALWQGMAQKIWYKKEFYKIILLQNYFVKMLDTLNSKYVKNRFFKSLLNVFSKSIDVIVIIWCFLPSKQILKVVSWKFVWKRCFHFTERKKTMF